MKKLITLLCIPFIIGCDRISMPGGESESQPSEIYLMVEGMVVDDSTNSPIDSVRVSITTARVSFSEHSTYFWTETVCSALTDAKGVYSLSGILETGRYYQLKASKSNYYQIPYTVYIQDPYTEYHNYQNHLNIDIRLKYVGPPK